MKRDIEEEEEERGGEEGDDQFPLLPEEDEHIEEIESKDVEYTFDDDVFAQAYYTILNEEEEEEEMKERQLQQYQLRHYYPHPGQESEQEQIDLAIALSISMESVSNDYRKMIQRKKEEEEDDFYIHFEERYNRLEDFRDDRIHTLNSNKNRSFNLRNGSLVVVEPAIFSRILAFSSLDVLLLFYKTSKMLKGYIDSIQQQTPITSLSINNHQSLYNIITLPKGNGLLGQIIPNLESLRYKVKCVGASNGIFCRDGHVMKQDEKRQFHNSFLHRITKSITSFNFSITYVKELNCLESLLLLLRSFNVSINIYYNPVMTVWEHEIFDNLLLIRQFFIDRFVYTNAKWRVHSDLGGSAFNQCNNFTVNSQ